MKPLLTVRVPATSANLGSGFDALGMALSLYNVFEVLELLPKGEYSIEVLGEGAGELQDPSSNLVIKSYETACAQWGVEPRGLYLRSRNVIPLCRGLGSSAGAVVAGVLIADAVSEGTRSREELLRLMVTIEGHPDNIAPCFLGGMVVSCWDGEELHYVRLPKVPEDLLVVVATPEVRVKTSDARQVLPQDVSFGDAVFNLGRAALLVACWATGEWDQLPWAMDDRLHQPYRAKLFPGGEVIMERVKQVPGCLGVAISGSGPSVLAFVRGKPQRVAETLCKTFSEFKVRSRFFVLEVDSQGATVIKGEEEK